jgi:hypothetical protein
VATLDGDNLVVFISVQQRSGLVIEVVFGERGLIRQDYCIVAEITSTNEPIITKFDSYPHDKVHKTGLLYSS